jgi:hypothetical protein
MTVFPFVGRELLRTLLRVSPEQWDALMDERAELVADMMKVLILGSAKKKK